MTLIKNRFGRIVNVPKSQANFMVKKGEAEIQRGRPRKSRKVSK